MSLPRGAATYKNAALLIIILLTFYIAISIRKYGRDKIYFHIEVIDFITYVRQQIIYFCAPTSKIISGYSGKDLKNSGIFDEGGIDRNIYLDERGKKLLKDYLSKLGKSSAEDQVANCDYTIDGMNSLLNEYKEDVQKKYKAYSTLVFIAGAMVMILLI